MKIEKRFDIQISQANEKVSKTFELDKTINLIRGMRVGSDKDALLYYRGSQRIEINGNEILPEGYESKYLMASINVPLNARYHTLNDLSPGNGKVKLEFQDTASTDAAFSAYRVSLYLLCEGE